MGVHVKVHVEVHVKVHVEVHRQHILSIQSKFNKKCIVVFLFNGITFYMSVFNVNVNADVCTYVHIYVCL